MGENKKVANRVVALSSAAVLAIYGAGYARTKAAADRFAQQVSERRPHVRASAAGENAVPLSVAGDAPAADAHDRGGTATASGPATVTAVTDATPPAGTTPTTAPSAGPAPTAAADTPSGPVPTAAAVTRPAADSTVTVAARAASAARVLPESPTATAADASPSQTPAAQVIPSAPAPASELTSSVPTVPPSGTAPAAPAPFTAVSPVPEPAKSGYADGTYYGWGSCRHGDIQAAVVIQDGKIAEARVERCLTRYSCSWITPIPPRILLKQGTTYDYVSGATESSDAFQDAVAEALSQAR